MPGIFPDYPAPIIRNAEGERELTMGRWGMPTSKPALFEATKKRAQKLEAKGKPVDFKALMRLEPDSGVTNIRNTNSAHWLAWSTAQRTACVKPLQHALRRVARQKAR